MCLKRSKKGKHSTVKKEKPKRKVSNIMLVLICTMIIGYTAADYVLQYFTSVEVSPTLTTEWFRFWSIEIVALAAIKTAKVIKDKKEEKTQELEDASDLNQEGEVE